MRNVWVLARRQPEVVAALALWYTTINRPRARQQGASILAMIFIARLILRERRSRGLRDLDAASTVAYGEFD